MLVSQAAIYAKHVDDFFSLFLIQISEAFKRFGISDGDDSVLLVLVHSEDESQLLADIKSMVDGQQVPVEDVSSLTDQEKIKKVYLLQYSVAHMMRYKAIHSK